MNIDFNQITSSFNHFTPEIILASFFTIGLLVDIVFKRGSRNVVGGWALLGFILAGWSAWKQASLTALTQSDFHGEWLFKAAHQVFGQGMYVVDDFAIYFKVLIAIAGVLVTVFSLLSRELITDGKP